MALTPQQRSASARLRGIVRSGGGTLDTTGLSIWREENAGEWKADIKEVTDALEALEVPYTVAIARRPAHRSAKRTPRIGWQAQIAWNDLHLLTPWMPKTLQGLIDAVAEDADQDHPGEGARLKAAAAGNTTPAPESP